MDKKGYKFYLEAEFKEIKPTDELVKEVASVIDLPNEGERQPDLSYFSAIFVSTGTNLNHAHFLGSEIVAADSTIPFKAVDIEHEEDQIIGHIYKHAYTDASGKELSIHDLKEKASLDDEEIHVEIACVIYKSRFPQIAQEVADNKWKVSMEAYFRDFDVLVGSTIMSKDEAAVLGFDVTNEKNYGQSAEVIKNGEVVSEGTLARVLRGICFSGVGIVKNPANPPSVVLEATAGIDSSDEVNVNENITIKDKDIKIIFNYDKLEKSNNNVTLTNIEDNIEDNIEKSENVYSDTIGICVNYKKELHDSVNKDQDSKVIQSNWCTKYDRNCTSPGGDATSPLCLRAVLNVEVSDALEKKLKDHEISTLTDNLIKIMKNS